jgi:hypothetical protein
MASAAFDDIAEVGPHFRLSLTVEEQEAVQNANHECAFSFSLLPSKNN